MLYKLLPAILLLALPTLTYAAPFITSDPTTQTVTHCGAQFDTAPKFDSVVQSDKSCKIDIPASLAPGVHTVKATYVNIDPVWGRSESVFSAPFTFTKPALSIPAAPAGLGITP